MTDRRRRLRRYKTAAIAIVVLGGGWIAVAACSNMDEGERCQVANNNDDCADGLICLPATQVNSAYNTSDRCCPPDRTQATHPACKLGQNPVAGDSAPPPDTGPVTTPDAQTDADAALSEAGGDADADVSQPDAADAATD